MKPDFNKPSHLVIGASAIIGVVLLGPRLGDGLEWLAYVLGTTKVAYAGKAAAEQVRSDFDRDLAERKEERKLEQQRLNLQQEYNKKLLEIQQQMPNQAAPPPEPPGVREWDVDGKCWECPVENLDQCYDEGFWRVCE